MVRSHCRVFGAVAAIWCVAILAADAVAGHRQSGSGGGGATVQYNNSRIAIDADGNFNDPDDWAASPAGLAILVAAGKRSRLVHYSYNNSLGSNANDRYFYNQMSHSIDRSIELYGLDRAVFFDAQRRLEAAIENLRREIDRSSASNRLFIIAKGPMELIYRAVKRSSPSRRAYTTVISHSNWNNKRVRAPEMTHNYQDVRNLGVKWLAIPDQNTRLYTKSGFSPWNWMRNSSNEKLRFIYSRMQSTGKADISDAGMVYFLLRNDPYATPTKLQRLLTGRG